MDIKTLLQNNNIELQKVLDAINNLPEKLEAFAVITVTYPEGSICTCTDGDTVLSLDNTSGYGFFLLPEAGIWTVTSTDPTDSTKTKSETVSITSEGQSESVMLSYALVLFDGANGGDNTEVTGGWAGDGHGWGTNGKVTATTTLKLQGNRDNAGAAKKWVGLTSNKIDTSKYSYVKANISAYTKTAYLVIYSAINSDVNPVASQKITEKGEVTLPIANCNGSYHIGLQLNSSQSSGWENVTALKIWLE